MKVADIKLFWRRSPSPDIVSQKVLLTVDGVQETGAEFGPEVEEMQITVHAGSAVSFQVESKDAEGETVASVIYNFQLGDLTAPLPATDLGHEIVAIRDDEPAPPVE